ncbi:MAG: efflux RND transporter periplasmic adaptor subunit, partial [Bacteroidales bacterium]|nr:efflux RND transporter periplasmic adaptor subunit [Bacteroidales bacterium]
MKRILYCAAILPLMIAGCSKKTDKEKQSAEQTPKVTIEVAQKQEIDQIYTFSSTVDAKIKNYISSAGGTRIEKIWVEVGDRVAKGQKLVTME